MIDVFLNRSLVIYHLYALLKSYYNFINVHSPGKNKWHLTVQTEETFVGVYLFRH